MFNKPHNIKIISKERTTKDAEEIKKAAIINHEIVSHYFLIVPGTHNVEALNGFFMKKM